MDFFKTKCSNINVGVDPSVGTAVVAGLAGVGLLSALSVTGAALKFLWRKHLRPAKKLRKYGEWAIVTGASDGIGREYCNYLAKQGTFEFRPRARVRAELPCHVLTKLRVKSKRQVSPHETKQHSLQLVHSTTHKQASL